MGLEIEDIISDWEKNCDTVYDQDLYEEISLNELDLAIKKLKM